MRERQFEGLKPLVAQAFDLRALGGEVIGLSVFFSPLVQVMHLLRRRIEGQFRVGDVVQDHSQASRQQKNDHNQQAEEEAQDEHPCRFFFRYASVAN
ncbi:hypothetical protein D3C87_1235220 [compost metagenome]